MCRIRGRSIIIPVRNTTPYLYRAETTAAITRVRVYNLIIEYGVIIFFVLASKKRSYTHTYIRMKRVTDVYRRGKMVRKYSAAGSYDGDGSERRVKENDIVGERI